MNIRFTINPRFFAAIVLLAASFAGAQVVKYSLPTDGKVSLGVYDAQGKLVRTLRSAEKQSKGDQTIEWDGKDSSGNAAPAGQYTWKLIEHQGLRAEYITTLGTSFGWHHWIANHGGPRGVIVEGDQIIVASGGSEVSPTLGSMSLDGTYRWVAPHLEPGQGVSDLAREGDTFRALLDNGNLYKIDAKTGKMISKISVHVSVRSLGGIPANSDATKKLTFDVPNGRYTLRLKIGQEKVATAALKIQVQQGSAEFPALKAGEMKTVFAPKGWSDIQMESVTNGKLELTVTNKDAGQSWAIPEIELMSAASEVDAMDGQMLVAFPSANCLAWIDPQTGKLLDRIEVVGPKAVALSSANEAVVLSKDQVVRISRKEAAPHVLIDGLTSPTRLDVDRSNGQIFVVESGNSHQIKRFDSAGKLLNTYGRAGGRQEGLYEPKDFRAVNSIAADGHGGFVITESDSAPRRTARFDAEGNLVNEWYGGQLFFTYMAIDPADPTIIWFDSHWGSIIQAKVDYEHKSWKILATYFSGPHESGITQMKGSVPGGYQVHHRNGQTYLVYSQGDPTVFRVDEVGRQLVPLMTSRSMFDHYWQFAPQAVKDMFKGSPPRDGRHFLSWSDLNADGAIEPDELEFSKWGAWAARAWTVDPSMDAHMVWMKDQKAGVHELIHWKLQSWTNGAPVYPNFDDAPRVSFEPLRGGVNAMKLDDAGNAYLLLHGGGDGFLAPGYQTQGHNDTWPTNMIDDASIAKFDPSGKLLWQTGTLGSDATQDGPGKLHFPMRMAGLVHDCIGVAERVIEPCSMWTTDGLYVGSVFEIPDLKAAPIAMYRWWRVDHKGDDNYVTNLSPINYDMLMGGDLHQLPNGDVIFACSGWNSVPLYRITGWDQFRRQEGKFLIDQPVTITPPTGSGLQAAYFDNPKLQGQSAVQQIDSRIWFDHQTNSKHPWLANPLAAKPFSVRWTGETEPEFSEDYILHIYAHGGVRLWVDGKNVIDSWLEEKPQKVYSSPIHMTAGKKATIRLECKQQADNPELHLCWESPTQSIQHIPTMRMYPASPNH